MYEKERDAAKTAAYRAGQILKGYFRQEIDVNYKNFKEPVTKADIEANQAIREVLMNTYPDYGWLSEESPDTLERLYCQAVWVVDPLDGTYSFIQGKEEFSISIALIVDNRPVVGVIYQPVKDLLFEAEYRKGAFLNDRRLSIANKPLSSASIACVSNTEFNRGFLEIYKQFFQFEVIGSTAYKMALLAGGNYDLYLGLYPKNDWDIAAGTLIIQEAGGKITDIKQVSYIFNERNTLKKGIIACHPDVYDEFFDIVTSNLPAKFRT